MKFYAISGEALTAEALSAEYSPARQIGVIRVGEKHLFFRSRLRVYAVPFADIRRLYRRVMLVPARMCCGRGNLNVENLVVEDDSGEIAQIQLPGTRAAVELIKELKRRLPNVDFTAPKKDAATEA